MIFHRLLPVKQEPFVLSCDFVAVLQNDVKNDELEIVSSDCFIFSET